MKQNPNLPSQPRRDFNPEKFRRHYVSAVESEDANVTEEEKGNLGRIFTFLLLLHVFLIGAVVVYNLIAEKPRSTPHTTAASPAKSTDSAPEVTPRSERVQEEETERYFVKSGQNLQDIALATGASMEVLTAINHLDEDGELFLGRELKYPKPKTTVPVATPVIQAAKVQEMVIAAQTSTAKTGEASFQAVEPSHHKATDSPPGSFVAKTTEKIQDKLPEEKSKDTKPAAGPVSKPKALEGKPVVKANPPDLKKEPATKPKEVAKPAAKASGTHEVKKKETFYSIARRYGVSVNDLMKVNGIKNASTLRDGTKLKIPANG